MLLLAGTPPVALPPHVGVAYYPEVAGDELDRDIRQMRAIGVNHVRMAEFAWSRMEPTEGTYDFRWLHQAVASFTEAGIAVVLCTPTATPPVWLSMSHPEILRVNAAGQTIGHGGRRQYCPNSPVYLRYAVGIAERLAAEFAASPAVIAWQVDNEFWEECFCPRCLAAFHAWLQRRFGTIEALNKAWLTVLWSQEYQSFEQVALPVPQLAGSGQHPSLRVAYRHFMSDSYVAFCNAQARVLKHRTSQPVTTNAHNPVYHRIDYEQLFAELDAVCFDAYAGPDNLLRYAFEVDWMRAMGKPFWFAETSSTHSGGTAVAERNSFAFVPGSLRAKMWLIYALGADAVCFWLWRAHWAGQELEHGSVVYPWGDECVNTGEIRTVARELAAHADWLRSTQPKPAAVALHYSVPMQWQFEASPIASGFNYDESISAFHGLLANSGVSRDVIMTGAEVDRYKVVFSPYLPAIDAELMRRMRHFVEQGGTWVLGPLSACRTTEVAAHQDACYGADFEAWLGIHVRHRYPPCGVTVCKADGTLIGCRLWCDAYELTQPDRRVLAAYSGGLLDGLAAVVECPIGRGRVVLLGTHPDDAWLQALIVRLVPPAVVKAAPGVMVVERETLSGAPAGAILINTRREPAAYRMAASASGTLAGYGVEIVPVSKTVTQR